ncbi:hypothetical protein PIB30_029358 [Stylosanthes scabra]|uniref:Uncharacterized protein n=1 Tax=Stylosanthes scabra TaxID=79078 RepID=A0ABU6SCS7_9FABA|nr:hypothetical protein [Stylosanthes scabra]
MLQVACPYMSSASRCNYILALHAYKFCKSRELDEEVFDDEIWAKIGIEKSMRKAKKNIGSKDGLEKACEKISQKKQECEGDKRSYSHRIGANMDSLER